MPQLITDLEINSGRGGGQVKPLVSYCLFTYKQERYIGESVDAALAQTYSPLEIIISDDCSSDQTFAIIEEKVRGYRGPHRVLINRNAKNLGIGGHISFLTSLAKGEYIVTVGGDDISSPNHVEKAVEVMQASADVYLADFDGSTINEDGEVTQQRRVLRNSLAYCLDDFLTLRRKISTYAPGRIIHRDVVNKFPPIAANCPTEDTVFVLRALILGQLRREPINLIQYRRTEASVSSSSNIGQLSVDGIIGQYRTDADHAFQNGLLSQMDVQRLERRLALEDYKRRLKSQSKPGGINAKFAKYKVRFYKTLYRLRIYIGPLKNLSK